MKGIRKYSVEVEMTIVGSVIVEAHDEDDAERVALHDIPEAKMLKQILRNNNYTFVLTDDWVGEIKEV